MNPVALGRILPRINFGFAVGLGLYFFLLPGISVLRDLRDPALRTDALPRAAHRLFRSLTPRYARWARERVAAGCAEGLTTEQIAATEWPMFGSVFYLWAVEELQADWEHRAEPRGPEPRAVAREAIEAATDLVLDPRHAGWVKVHWGEDYLSRENVFYRMLLISAMTSHCRLTGQSTHVEFLREQAESLAAELDSSPHGVLDDYPAECYPGDVLMAIAAIRRADAVLGTDHSAFAARASRGFEGAMLDRRGLPPYAADAVRGIAFEPSRGCGISYACMSAPYLWRDRAVSWYERYERFFWHESMGLRGFREFPKDQPGSDWYFDVDSGPVLGGIGVSASAFGVAASRILGRFDRAWPLAAQMIVFGWPLSDGTWLTPRILSNAAHAPYLGEACILYVLTRRTAPGADARIGGALPPVVLWAGGLYFLLGLAFVRSEWRALRARLTRQPPPPIPWPRHQATVWIAILCASVFLVFRYNPTIGALALLAALPFPAVRRIRNDGR